MRRNRGITLITLVIIIILITVLAGILLNISLKDNGLFIRAKEAKEEIEKASIIEKIKIEIMNNQIEKDEQNISEEVLEEILQKYGEVQKDETGRIIYIKVNKLGYNIPIKDILNEEKIKDLNQKPNEPQESEEKIRKITLDKQELTIEVGSKGRLVVTIEPKDVQNKVVEWTTDNEQILNINNEGEVTALKEGTTIVTVSAKNDTTINDKCTVTIIKAEIKPGQSGYKGGNYNDPYIPVGFQHTGIETWNQGYVITGIGDGIAPDEFVWVPCVLTSDEQQSAKSNGDNVEILKKITTGSYIESGSVISGDRFEIRKSVEKYGGFYIARYEAGIEGTKDNYSLNTKKPTNGIYKPLSQPNKGVWNYITTANAEKVSEAMIDYNKTGVHSILISGDAWDTTLQWIVNSSDNKFKNVGYDENSKGRGWYNDISEGKVKTTGQYSVNNIYDMAGNIWEFTSEDCVIDTTEYVVRRGGNFSKDPIQYPAASRLHHKGTETVNIGFRTVIYK